MNARDKSAAHAAADSADANGDFIDTMRKLDAAEQLLASCSVRGGVDDHGHNNHMAINRQILEAARRQLAEVEAAMMPMAEPGVA